MINGLALAVASAEPIIGHREAWVEYSLPLPCWRGPSVR